MVDETSADLPNLCCKIAIAGSRKQLNKAITSGHFEKKLRFNWVLDSIF